MKPEDLLANCCLAEIGHLIRARIGELATCEQGHDLVYGRHGWHVATDLPTPHRRGTKKMRLGDERPPPVSPSGPYTSEEVIGLCNISYRKLDYWCRQGWIEGQVANTGWPGWQRRFTERQVDRVRQLEFASRLKAMTNAELADYIAGHFLLVRPVEDVPVQQALL
jgi:hypothetical protein